MRRLTKMTPAEKKLGWFYWAFQLVLLPVILVLLNNHFGSPMTETELNLLFFVLNFVLLLLIFHKFIFHSCKTGILRPFRTLRWAFFGFGLYWLCSLGVGWLILDLNPEFVNVNDQSIFLMLEENYSLTVLGTVLLAPVAEELLYRGLIFGTLYERSKLLAYIASTLLFALVHIVGYITIYDLPTLLLCLLQYLPAGLCLGFAYARTGSILTPILAHIAVNQIAISSAR